MANMGRSLRVAVTFVIAAVALATAAPRAWAQTVDEIIARNIQARGGAEKIKAVQSMKQTSHMKIQAMSATLTLYAKRPNLSRQEMTIAGATAVAAFDGQSAWGLNPMMGQTRCEPRPPLTRRSWTTGPRARRSSTWAPSPTAPGA
jgi:outer membrane lipoprotein-sorting protein